MSTDLFEFQAEVCKTFSNPRRLQILNLLKSGEVPVSEITKALGTSKANVSQHLAVMRMRGLVKTRRDGAVIHYRMANEQLAEACSMMQDALVRIMDGERENVDRGAAPQPRPFVRL